MQASLEFARNMLTTLRRQRRALLLFHLFFMGLAAIVLLPAASWLTALLLAPTGEPALGNRAVTDFLLSPLGLLWLLTVAMLFLLLSTLQRAGMIVIAAEHHGGVSRQVVTALIHVARKSPRLLRLALLRAAAHLALALPFLLAIYAVHDAILGGYNDVLRTRPPAMWWFLAAAAPFLAMIVLLNGALYLRWMMAVPCLMLEHASVRAALRRSHRLVSGTRLRLAGKALVLALAVLAMPAVLVFVFERLIVPLLGLLPDRFDIIVPATLAVLALYILFAIVVSFLGVSGAAVFLYTAYRQAAGRPQEPLPARQAQRAGLLSWGAEAILLLVALAQAGRVLDHFELVDDVAVIAHRGSSHHAPENSLAAIERALEDGVDLVELDVRESANGTPVLMHDRDLRRVAGVARTVHELSDVELAQLDIGSRIGERYSDERVPTLDAALHRLQGRAIPLLDLKPVSIDSPLLPRSLALLQENRLLDHAWLAATDPALLREARRLAPTVRTVYLIHFSIGTAASLEFDALGVRASRLTPELVRAAHARQRKVFVFTVNGREEMSRFIDMGVNGIITDRPDVLQELLAERAGLSEGERLVIKLRNWLHN